MGEALKFVTTDGVLEKNAKNFLLFYKNDSILRPFELNFGLKDLFLTVQNVHKISIKRTGGKYKYYIRISIKMLNY